MKNRALKILSFISRHKIATRVLSFMLSLIMLFYVAPAIVYGEIIDALSEENNSEATSTPAPFEGLPLNSGSDYPAVSSPMYEVNELREDSVKHFRLSDGSYIAAKYTSAVHYRDSLGAWQDIDNTLSDDGIGGLSTSDSRIKFSKNINGSGNILKLKSGSYEIDLSVINGNKGSLGEVVSFGGEEDKTELQKMLNLEKLSSSVIYRDIFSGADMEYLVHSNTVSEKIIITERGGSRSYSFELKLKGLNAELSESGCVVFSDSETGDTVYILPALTVMDNSGACAPNNASSYTLTNDGKKYTLTVDVSAEWINTEDRAFPVTLSAARSLDSSFETGEIKSENLNVTYVKLNTLIDIPENSYTSKVMLTISDEAPETAYGLYEVTSDWTSNISYGSYLNGEGQLADTLTDSSGESYSFNITELVSKWKASPEENYGVAITALGEGAEAAPMAYSMRSSTAPAVAVEYSITAGLEDYFSYTSHSIGAAGNVSVNNATGQLNLSIPTISNRNQVMPMTLTLVYNSYLSGKAHIAGNADVPFDRKILPYGFKVNTTESILEKSYTDENGNSKLYYVLEDADGTTHKFYETSVPGVYQDADGLQKKLTFDSYKSEIYIEDDTENKKIYTRYYSFRPTSEATATWVLSSVVNDFESMILINGQQTSKKLFGISFSSVDESSNYISSSVIEPIYDDTVFNMCVIVNRRSMDFAILRFSETYNGELTLSDEKNYLRRIDFGYVNEIVSNSTFNAYYDNPEDYEGFIITQTAEYEYDSLGRIIEIKDVTQGRSISYNWDTQGRVIKITEYGGDSKGQEISFTYGTGYTDVRAPGNDEALGNSDDIFTRYTFDENGRCVSLYSYSADHKEIYGATTGKYETQENVKNSLSEQAVVGEIGVNYLLNGDFEQRSGETGFAYWNLSSEAYSGNATTLKTHGHHSLRLNPSIGGSAYAEQYVFLKAGTYTLSMLMQTQEAEGHSAYAEITSLSGSGLNHSEKIGMNPNGLNGIKSSFATTFTVPSHVNGGDNVRVKIRISSESTAPSRTSFYIDDVALCKGINSADYSYVKYGTFEESGITSSGTVSESMSSQWKTQSNGAPITIDSEAPFEKVVKVTANNGASYVKHRLYALDQEYIDTYDYDPTMYIDNVGCEFVVSGFAKASEASLSSGASFCIKVDVVYYQGRGNADIIDTYTYEFIPTADDWQFVFGTFDTEHVRAADDTTGSYLCIKAIDIYCDYSNQSSGYALFDNITVVNAADNSIVKYDYTESGLLSRIETQSYNEYYFYDEATRNLKRTANNKGEITDYEYTDTSRPKVLTQTFDYDFSYLGLYDYPYEQGINPTNLIKTPKTKTQYEYIPNGLIKEITTSAIEYDEDGAITEKENVKKIKESFTYALRDANGDTCSAYFAAVKTSTDTLGVVTRYFYDPNRGYLLATVNESTGDGTAYTYDAKGNLSLVTPAEYVSSTEYTSVTNAETVNYTYNSNNLLSTISTESTVYTFNYDVFGNSSSVKAGSNTLASYEYYPNNGKLKKITYGNSFAVDYVYNRLEMLSEIWYTESGVRSLKYSYEYTDDGQVYKYTDHTSGKSTVYRYDNVGKLISFSEYDNSDMYHDFSTEIFYNPNRNNEVGSTFYKLNYVSSTPKAIDNISYYYTRNPDGVITETRIQTDISDGWEEFTYDDYDRVTAKEVYLYSPSDSSIRFDNDILYSYKNSTDGANTSGLVSNYTSKINGMSSILDAIYYDNDGNITMTASSIAGRIISYKYDELGQLIREDNQYLGITYLYEYDNAGNITAVKICNYTTSSSPTVTETKNYTYSSGAWGDLLTAYNGNAITYDAIGNPLTYNNGTAYTFTWSGRQLVGATKGGNTYSFAYNDEGIRTSKTKNGVTTTYYLSGSQIIAEETGGNLTVYLYDTAGLPVGMQYHLATADENTWELYWFEKNLQGDIVAVYNQAGTKLVSYKYDAWGNTTINYFNGGASTKAADNPFTYRGYYYDRDLEMYYLGSRYYDSVVKRFINVDAFVSTGQGIIGNNMFSYCENNPMNHKQRAVGSSSSINTSSASLENCNSVVPSTVAMSENIIQLTSSKSVKFDLFGYEYRTSAGWYDSPNMASGFLGRIGVSSYITNTKGRSGMFYAFTGSTSDVMNWFDTTYYAGVGINIFDTIGTEVQLETLGIGAELNVGKFNVSADVNLIGGTSITFGVDTDLGNDMTKTDAFTIGANTGSLVAVIFWLYKFASTGDLSPVPGL